jgi:hypothetical protein
MTTADKMQMRDLRILMIHLFRQADDGTVPWMVTTRGCPPGAPSDCSGILRITPSS